MTQQGLTRFSMPETLATGVFEALRWIDRSMLFIAVINHLKPNPDPTTLRQPRCESFNRDVEQRDEQQES